ncbi:hypothetical protein SAMN05877838_3775 [Hoeflea halophila]|uniref:Uncharacterized protein n=1 Tax=Hoeflea halophila TaxID=714899 RepID=A0A286IFJ2_9HYPH|nr:hypothetical protein [Hoeflea halophila]SOE18831.1 hypothetical protein SAMN05877838_3775 [Hoeflea halophila]
MANRAINEPAPCISVQGLSVEFWGITDAVRWNSTAAIGIPDGDYTFGYIFPDDNAVFNLPDAWLSIRDGIFADYQEICGHAAAALFGVGVEAGDFVVKGPVGIHGDGTVMSFFILSFDDALARLDLAA